MDLTNAGTSLVAGIQDISAFLPIIGTEQCEKHVGEALEGGFLYAAAAPLSMFGSLGIVKASAAILVASISPRFAQMLADAGFTLDGSVAAMIGTSSSTRDTATRTKSKANESKDRREKDDPPRYHAAQKFQELLEEQHIDKSQLEVVFDYYSWNWGLCVSTALLACLSITPYIRLIMDDKPSSKPFPAWAPPLMRIVGSAVSVVVAQMIIQIQMQRIIQLTLDGAQASSPTPKIPLNDPEKGNDNGTSEQLPNESDGSLRTATAGQLSPLYADKTNPPALPMNVPSHLRLALLQVLLFVGISSTAVGYLGCFTIVQNAKSNNTYIWLGVEIALALLRIYIWGLNPAWDEQTGLTLILQLSELAPTITTAQDYETRIIGSAENRLPFVVLADARFLDYISPYTGPVERFGDPDNHVAIYYTLAASASYGAKVLLTTVLDLETRSTFVLVHHCPLDATSGLTVYSASSEIMQDTGIMTAICGDILHGKHDFRQTERFRAIAEHSGVIANRIGGIDRVTRLPVSWNLKLDFLKPERNSGRVNPHKSPLTDLDKEYLELQRLAYIWRTDFDRERDLHILECMTSALDLELLPVAQRKLPTFSDLIVPMEKSLVYESASFEKELLAKTMPSHAPTGTHIFYEYARRLDIRVANDARKEGLAKRIAKYRDLASSVETSESYVVPDDILTRVESAARGIDAFMGLQDGTSETVPWDSRSNPHSAIHKLWALEQEQRKKRVALWANCGTSSKNSFAEAIFAAYPSAGCVNDPELLEIMTARGCTVFDFGYADREFPAFLDKIKDVVSLLRCPDRWLPRVAQSHPRILAIEFLGNSALTRSALQATLQKRRREWGTNTPLSTGLEFCFCFSAGFSATGPSMRMKPPGDGFPSLGFLLVKTAQAGKFRVTFWHCDGKRNDTSLSWSLETGEQPLLGTIQVPQKDFKRDSFTVEVPAGIHHINIRIVSGSGWMGSYYNLRRVWVTPVNQDNDQAD